MRVCVEATPARLRRAGDIEQLPQADVLYLSLLTPTAYTLQVAAIFTQELLSRLCFAHERQWDLQTSLQEGLTNAIVHGNLEIGQTFGPSLASMRGLEELIKERLAAPDYASRRIRLHATWDDKRLAVSILNEGDGYDPRALHLKSRSDTAPTGRGFLIMGECCDQIAVRDRGRCIVLNYEA